MFLLLLLVVLWLWLLLLLRLLLVRRLRECCWMFLRCRFHGRSRRVPLFAVARGAMGRAVLLLLELLLVVVENHLPVGALFTGTNLRRPSRVSRKRVVDSGPRVGFIVPVEPVWLHIDRLCRNALASGASEGGPDSSAWRLDVKGVSRRWQDEGAALLLSKRAWERQHSLSPVARQASVRVRVLCLSRSISA